VRWGEIQKQKEQKGKRNLRRKGKKWGLPEGIAVHGATPRGPLLRSHLEWRKSSRTAKTETNEKKVKTEQIPEKGGAGGTYAR